MGYLPEFDNLIVNSLLVKILCCMYGFGFEECFTYQSKWFDLAQWAEKEQLQRLRKSKSRITSDIMKQRHLHNVLFFISNLKCYIFVDYAIAFLYKWSQLLTNWMWRW